MQSEGWRSLMICLGWLVVLGQAHAATVYVDSQATSGGLGTSWSDALPTITQGLAAAQSGDHIWVAQGTYGEAIVMKSGVALFGGFDKTEATINDRDWREHATIIDGSTARGGQPAYHVVTMDTIINTRLDGFTITGGIAAGLLEEEELGGGILCRNMDPSSTITRCFVYENKANNGGGVAVLINGYGEKSAPFFSDMLFSKNSAQNLGGSVYVEKSLFDDEDCAAQPFCMRQSVFFDNTSALTQSGNIVIKNICATIDNCIFAQNTNAEVACFVSEECQNRELKLSNSVFVGNTVGNMAAVYSEADTSAVNCIFDHNWRGIQTGPNASDTYIRIYNNLFRDCSMALILADDPGDGDFCIYNNLFVQSYYFGIWYNSVTHKGQVRNNLFWGNAEDVNASAFNESQQFTGVNELMEWYTNDHASGLLSADPGIVSSEEISLNTNAVFDAQRYRTIISGLPSNYTPGTLKKKIIAYSSNNLRAVIDSNTTATLTVIGNIAKQLNDAGSFKITNHHLVESSPAIDAGCGGDGIPVLDITGHSRPVDIPNVGADGTGAEYDLGPYERYSPAQQPNLSITPDTLDFAQWSTTAGPSPAQSLTLHNDSIFEELVFTSGGLTLGGPDGDQFVFVGVPDISPLGPGASREVSIAFDPSTGGAKSAWLEINTNDPSRPQAFVTLSGQTPAPLAPSIVIFPASPRTTNDVIATPSVAGSEPIATYEYQWTKDGIVCSTDRVLSHTLTTKGQSWTCRVRAQDIWGLWGPWGQSASIIIVNSPPTQPFVKILPDPAQAGQDIIVDVQVYSIDPDGDEVAYDFDWFKSTDNGQTWIHKVELDGSSQVSGLYINEGELWQVHYTPYEKASATTSLSKDGVHKTDDGRIEGRFGWDQVYVGDNHAPTFATLLYGLAQEDALVRLCTTWDAQDRDGDSVSVNLYWLDSICSQIGTVGEGMGAAHSLRLHPLAEVDPELHDAVRLYYVALDSRGAVRQFLSDPMPLSQAITHLSLSDYLLGKCEPGNEQILDFNGDGLVDVCDVVKLVNE